MSLKLRATDAEDLSVIAAVTQDALVPINDMSYLAPEKRFVLALNRFRWESAGPTPPFERINSGLCFEHVTKVSIRGLDLKRRDQILDLLTITLSGGALLLQFAGNRDIRLDTSALDCRLDDFGDPWPTATKPRHTGPHEGWSDWQ